MIADSVGDRLLLLADRQIVREANGGRQRQTLLQTLFRLGELFFQLVSDALLRSRIFHLFGAVQAPLQPLAVAQRHVFQPRPKRRKRRCV